MTASTPRDAAPPPSVPLTPGSIPLDHQAADQQLTRIAFAFIACAAAWLVLGTLIGTYISLKFVWPDLGIAPWLSVGRLRPIHTNLVLFGWASLAGIGLALLVVPRTSRTTLRRQSFVWTALVLLNAALIAGTACLLAGINNGAQEYREWLWPVMGTFVAGLVLLLVALYRTVALRGTEAIYISNWYILGAFFWIATLVTVGYLPWYQHGLSETVIQGYYMHNVVGMWFTPLALGMTYYALPKLLNKPVYSYALGVLAFWTQLLFYTMIGAHHFVFSPTPWSLQTVAIVFSIGMIVPVVAGTANFLLTIRGDWSTIADSYALPFIFVGVIMYFVASMQGTLEAFRSLNTIWHFTDFTVAHSHMAMYGFVSFIFWGGIYGLIPPLTGRHPPLSLVGVQFWFALIGLTIYAVALMVGGTLRGLSWIHGAPFIDSVVLMTPYWTGRMIGGTLMFLSHLIFAYNVWRMRPMAPVFHVKHLDTHTNLPLLFSLIGVGFVALTFAVAIAPSTWVSAHNAPVAGSKALSPEEAAGLRVYVSEGCPYCHTQQVRPLPEDSMFGRPSAPGDYARLAPLGGLIQIPEMLGTERTGPDLSDVAARQPSDVWQYIHLYQPRALVGASIMPAFQWLFVLTRTPDSASVRVPVPPPLIPQGMTVVATPRAKALVAYLLSLKQTPIAGSTPASPGPASSATATGTAAAAAGAQLYASRCASCHQATGNGVPGAFPPLAGDPVVNGPAPAHLDVIINGLHGRVINGTTYSGIMPPWGALMSDAEIAAVATHERTSWGNHGSAVTPDDVTAARKLPPPTP